MQTLKCVLLDFTCRGRGSVVKSASEFKSEDPRFDPLAGQSVCIQTVVLSTRVNSCTDSFVADPPSCQCTARTHICAHVKDLISICRKRVGLAAGGMETHKHCTQGKENIKLGSAVLWLLAFPGGKQPEFPVHCIGTRKRI